MERIRGKKRWGKGKRDERGGDEREKRLAEKVERGAREAEMQKKREMPINGTIPWVKKETNDDDVLVQGRSIASCC